MNEKNLVAHFLSLFQELLSLHHLLNIDRLAAAIVSLVKLRPVYVRESDEVLTPGKRRERKGSAQDINEN